MQGYTYTKGEHYPVEHLVFKTAPEDVQHYLDKEVWVNDNKPGEIHMIFVWESIESWRKVDDKEYQAKLIQEFEEKFGRPYELIRVVQNEENFGVHRYSRFERI